MSFLDALGADCEVCPTPHSICDFTFCGMCGPCPTAIEHRRRQAEARARYQAGAPTKAPRPR